MAATDVSLRARALAAVSAAIVLLAGAVLWWASGPLRAEVRERWAGELEREARLAAEHAGDGALSDSLADHLGEAVGHRVTLVGRDGRPAGDSEISADRLSSLGGYSDRPEVRAALEGRVGTDVRASDVVARELLYVAVPHREGVLRVAMPAAELDRPVTRLRRVTVAAAAGVLLLLLVLAAPLERFLAAPFRPVRRALDELREGELSTRLRPSGDDEPARLAAAADRLAGRMEEVAGTLQDHRDLEEIFQRMDEGLAVVDDDGRVTRTNAAFLDLLGREDAVGQRFGTLFRDPAPRELLQRGLGGEAASREIELGDVHVLLSVRPFPGGAVVTSRDLTRLRRLEGVRRDFVANVSHELKTPLTSVLGFAEALADAEMPPEQARDFGRRILENGVRMRRMIEELMDLSRVESGTWEPEPVDVPLAEAARAAWQAVGGRDRELELDFDGETTVRADRDALRSVLRNLLDNAARYSPAGETVTVAAERSDDMIRIEVRDRGPGIPTAHLGRVFERFYRVDTGRSREEGGTGLGLAIVKHLVRAHGGEVGAESEVGSGSAFWFTLPAGD